MSSEKTVFKYNGKEYNLYDIRPAFLPLVDPSTRITIVTVNKPHEYITIRKSELI
ncbi:MAG: hypothetical protein MUF50_02050 [Planctomycetes bacterium]|jgi:hypothetical protein|nr:hypothetical protein [Planctomycetota bacterium]